MPPFDACLACGLQRGEVTAARLVVETDRRQFTLSLDCTPSASRAREIAESFLRSRPQVRELLVQTSHGSWRWRDGSLERVDEASREGVAFVVSADESLPDDPELWERFLATFRVSLTESWRQTPLPPEPGGYDASQIRVLEGLAPIRRRPQMYIGPVADPHLLVDILLRHAALGWLAGTTKTIEVELSTTGTLSVRDDGYPFSFEPRPQDRSWVETAFGRVFGPPRESRGPHDRARNEFGESWYGLPLAVATALSTELMVESSDRRRSGRQRFTRGRPEPSEQGPPWHVDGTRITFTPDLNLLDVPLSPARVRTSAERLVSLCPGHEIQFNGVRLHSQSVRAAAQGCLAATPAWNDVLFEHTFKNDSLVLRCAIGLSRGAKGELESVVNLSPPTSAPEQRIRGEHIDALVDALVDAVKLPCKAERARDSDLVGIVCLERPGPQLDRVLRLAPHERDSIRRSLVAPLSVFLDSIPQSRETLAARWR